MGRDRLTRSVHAEVKAKVDTLGGGDVSWAAKEREQQGLGLDPNVDPKVKMIRRSLPRYTQLENGLWKLNFGVPMPKKTAFDTTGSMGGNIRMAFNALPLTYDLLSQGPLKRYDLQEANGAFDDRRDKYIVRATQFEMGKKIPEQLTLIEPLHGGDDIPEDPEYSLFLDAYLSDLFINRYGLLGYNFLVTDAPGRGGKISHELLIRVFGEEVYAKVKENGHQINQQDLPDVKQIVDDLKKKFHAFMLQIEEDQAVNNFWVKAYGRDRVIVIPDASYLPYVQYAVIGLTEGTLQLQTLEKLLIDAGCRSREAAFITRAVAKIPIGAQAKLPNFKKIPGDGALFKNKHDLWPIDTEDAEDDVDVEKPVEKPASSPKKPKAEKPPVVDDGDWL